MKRTLLILALVCIALAAIAGAATAENAPSWRGQQNTTHLDWTAGTPPTMNFSSVGSGLYPMVQPSLVVESNYISSSIPNFYLTNNPVKYMRIQIWWDMGGEKPTFNTVNGIYGVPGDETVYPFTLVGEMGDPVYSLTDWEIHPNPFWEQISLSKTPATNINRVIIDTWCVPEPSSLLALAGGIASLLGFRRRRP